MALRTRYAAPATDQRFGTSRRDPANNNRLIPGEVNQYGLPMGQRPLVAAAPAQPSALDRFQAWSRGGTAAPLTNAPAPGKPPQVAAPVAPAFNADAELAKAKARTYGPSTVPAFGLAMNTQPPRVAAPVPMAAPASTPPVATPATAPVARTPWGGVPTHPDDAALLTATRARDAAARAPEPISIPGGLTGHALARGVQPWAPGADSAEGQALANAVNRANAAGQPTQLATNPDRARLDAEAARTGSVRYVPTGTPEARAVVSNTGVTRAPMLAGPTPVPAAATTAPPQGIPRPQPDWINPTVPATPSSTPAPAMSDPLAQPVAAVAAAPIKPAASEPSTSPVSQPSTGAYALGQSVAQGAGNRALAITGSVDRNVVKPVMDTLNAGQNFVNGFMGSNFTEAPYTAMPRIKPPSLSQPPATTAARVPALPFKFNDPRFQMPSSITPNAPTTPAFKPVLPTPPQLTQDNTDGSQNRSSGASAQPAITPASSAAWSATPSRVPYQSPVTQSAYDSGADDGSEVRATNPPPVFRAGPPPSLMGSPMDSALIPFKPRKKATPLDEPANQYN